MIETELTMAGGFYAGAENYYLVYGQENSHESDSVEVVRVVKYDKDWHRLDSLSVYGANTSVPFDAGCVRMTDVDGMLYVRTSHTMYESPDGLNHQANMTIVIKEEDMSLVDQATEVDFYSQNNKYNMGYVSHSFNQFVITDDGGNVVFLDQGDAYPRAVQIAKEVKEKWGKFDGKYILQYKGNIGKNFTGATIGGFEYSENNYLTVGTADASWSMELGNYVGNYMYLSINDRQLKNKTQIICLGKSSDKKLYSTPQLVKISNDKFLVLWSEKKCNKKSDDILLDGKIRYVYVDGEGRLLGKIQQAKGDLSDCQPILVNGSVVWTICDNENLIFNRINKNGVYFCTKADYQNKIIKYPIKMADCHLVAKRIGQIESIGEDADEKDFLKSFVLYGIDLKDKLKYDVDYTMDGYGRTKSSITGEKWYVKYLSAEAVGERFCGNATFYADSPDWGKTEFIHERPQNVSAKRIDSGIKIKWQEEPYALGYYVYRKYGNDSYKKIATISDVSKNFYVDKNVSKNKTYSYYIKTYTTNGKKLISTKRSEIKIVR